MTNVKGLAACSPRHLCDERDLSAAALEINHPETMFRHAPPMANHSAAANIHPFMRIFPAPPSDAPKPSDTAVTRVADRDALLARLRERRAGMSDEKKDAVLNKPR